MRGIVVMMLVSILFPVHALASTITCQLSRNECEVGLDPAKEKIVVFGEGPEDAPIIIKLQGPKRPVLVSLYKDQSFIKFNEIEVQGLPGYYQILTSIPIDKIDSELWYQLGVSSGYEQLKTDAWIRMRQNAEDSYSKHQQDYINLALQQKENDHLYAIRQGVVERNGREYRVEIPLIAGMPIGQIKVTTMTVMDNEILYSQPQLLNIKPASLLSLGSQEVSISAMLVITLFMVPIILLTVAQILEFIEQKREQERRAQLLKQIWQ
ncbi:hypothetical protein Dred_1314 [Desulforamulus reducens MI-1]|uniref:Transmembrane protein n=1 Tax=Desulforamulus reducens (strain ATCC BAA-1160 / DSM 100696 / MI-1) TaxID=349161 RepID=A4J445_DESRM|nr:TIGR02186 family protein [Desulforamulus reducens]ABO49848.1 hypothetical protein Dred_1314 [Desulforamulus reducens MI-1]